MDVSVGTAWRRAWAETPPEVQKNRALTRGGMPTARVWRSVVNAVLGEDWNSDLAYRHKGRMVSSVIQDKLIQDLEAHAEDLRRIAELLDVVVMVVDELATGDIPASNLKKLRDDWTPLVLDLWRAGAVGRDGVRQRVLEELDSPIAVVRALLRDPAEEAVYRDRVDQFWVPVVAIDPPAKPPSGQAHSHWRIPEEMWEQTVGWLHGAPLAVEREGEVTRVEVTLDQIRGWAIGLHLASDLVTPPRIHGGRDTSFPMDRSVVTRLARLMAKDPHLVDDGLDPRGLLEREIHCATSPLGLPTTEARAALMLGYWLVTRRSFDETRREFRQLLRELEDGEAREGEDSQAAERSAVVLAQDGMYRAVWNRIRLVTRGPKGSRSGASGARMVRATPLGGDGEAELIRAEDIVEVPETEGLKRLIDPEPTFMRRLWSRVHTYSHRERIGAEVAAKLITGVWHSWVKDVGSAMAELPRGTGAELPEHDGATNADVWPVLQIVIDRGGGEEALALLRQINDTDDPMELQGQWLRMVERAGVPDEARAESHIDDVEVVADYLTKHMR